MTIESNKFESICLIVAKNAMRPGGLAFARLGELADASSIDCGPAGRVAAYRKFAANAKD